MLYVTLHKPMPVTARSKAFVCGCLLAETVGSYPAGGMDDCLLWVLSVLSGRGLCDGPITRPGKCYRVWCAWVWSLSPGPLRAVELLGDPLSITLVCPPVSAVSNFRLIEVTIFFQSVTVWPTSCSLLLIAQQCNHSCLPVSVRSCG